MKYLITTYFILLMFHHHSVFSQEKEISVFDPHSGRHEKWIAYQDNHKVLYDIILNEATILLDKRKAAIENLNTSADWKSYQKHLHAELFSQLSEFQKSPLNAKTTGVLERKNYTVEKVYFESFPGFVVTAGLFIPKNLDQPAPAVIYCSGHTGIAFRSETYQQVIINLVEKGFVVLAFDPIGQGERLQYLYPQTGNSKIGGSTSEHSYAGAQTLLTGRSLSDFFTWDGVRAIDYLETREEVDASRIGITGRSGGGTQAALIAAYDKRILAAAPECYITNFKRLLQSIGPQDAEQNPYRAIYKGFDHPDFLHIRASKPTLIITTTHDFFSQQGARETFTEVQKSFGAFNKLENIQFTEDYGVHESTKANRESLYKFFQKHLNLPGENADSDIKPFTPEELQVTQTGQVASSLNSKSIYDLNLDFFEKHNPEKEELIKKIIELSGIQFSRNLTESVYTGKVKIGNNEFKKYFLENSKNDFALPVFVAQPNKTSAEEVLVWLHPEGKTAPGNQQLLTDLIAKNITIVLADLPDMGELSDPGFRGDGFVQGVPFNYTFGANLVGKSIPGIQAEALDILMQFVMKQFPAEKLSILAEGHTGSAVLHYSALKHLADRLILKNPVPSAKQIIETEYYNPADAYFIVPGSAPFYDFEDLKSLLTKGTLYEVECDEEVLNCLSGE